MLLPLLMLTVGFVLLIKGADLFVSGAAYLTRRLGVSSMTIGLTVVAFGTSAPELFVNVAAAVSGDAEIALGNVVGSNIANVLLILGVAALIRPLTVTRGTVWKEIPFCLLAAIVLWVMASDVTLDRVFFSTVSRSDGLILLGYFAIFLAYSVSIAVPGGDPTPFHPPPSGRPSSVAIKMLVGFCGLLFGGRMIVDHASALATMLGLSPAVVGLTVVALGTSLPELATSAVAARRGEVELAVGNVVGSNIFNVFFILGISAVIRPLPVDPAVNIDMGMMTAASTLLFVFMFTGRERVMDRFEGILALLIYGIYVGYLFVARVPLTGGGGVTG